MYDIKIQNIDTFGSLRELNTRDKAVELHVFVLAQQLHTWPHAYLSRDRGD